MGSQSSSSSAAAGGGGAPKTSSCKDRSGKYFLSRIMKLQQSKTGHDKEDRSDGDDDEDDGTAFYRDLQQAKKEKLGAEIPPDQLRDSAISGEEEFLNAMKQSQKEYQEAKEKQGEDSLSASDFFLQKIRKEEERQKQREEEEGMIDDDSINFDGLESSFE